MWNLWRVFICNASLESKTKEEKEEFLNDIELCNQSGRNSFVEIIRVSLCSGMNSIGT